MITREEFEEMFEKEYFCYAIGEQLVQLFYFQSAGRIARLRYSYDKCFGRDYVIFTILDKAVLDAIWWEHEPWAPLYEEFIDIKRWQWFDKSQKDKKRIACRSTL